MDDRCSSTLSPTLRQEYLIITAKSIMMPAATNNSSAYVPPTSMNKRRRDCSLSQTSAEVGLMVSELHQAVTTTQRRRVLQKVLHLTESLGTILVEAGAMRALCLQLGFVMNRPAVPIKSVISTTGEIEDQIGMVCCAMDSLYQNCAEYVREESVQDIGTELIQLLIKVWKKKRQCGQLTILSIWRLVSASVSGSSALILNPDFLPIMAEVLENHEISKSVKDETLGTLKYITHFAEDHRLLVLQHLGPLLARLGCSLLTDRSTERLSAIFRNLALTPSVRLAIAENSGILSALVQLCSTQRHQQQLTSGGPNNAKTLRNVLCTLDSLSLETDSCMLLLLHGDGMILGLLLHFLCTAGNEDVVRRRAARALRLLARDKAVPILLNSTNVLNALYFAAMHDASLDVRGEATIAYASCAARVNADLPEHSDIMACLTDLSVGPAQEAVASAFLEQVHHAANRAPIVQDSEFMTAMMCIALQRGASTSSKEHISGGLAILSEEEELREDLMTEPVLNVLVHNARESQQRHEGGVTNLTSRNSISTLLNLASSNESTRRRLVTHKGLLQVLIRFTSSCQDADAKENVKKTMLKLIPQL